MSEKSPIVAFGLKATAVALKAKNNQLRMLDKLELAKACLEWMGGNAKVGDAVVSFLALVDREPIEAANMLQELAAKLAPDSDPRRAEVVLKEIEREQPTSFHAIPAQEQFDWQKRKDLQ